MNGTPPRHRGRLVLAVLAGFLAWPLLSFLRSRREKLPPAPPAEPASGPHELRERRSRGPAFALAGAALTLLLFGGAALATAAQDMVGSDTTTESTADPTTAADTTTDKSESPPPEWTPPNPLPPALPPPPGDADDPPGATPPPSPVPESPPPLVSPIWLDQPDAATPDPEVAMPGTSATIWLYRALPDPTPPAKRLAPAFAERLVAVARRERVHWSLLLGVLRASGRDGRMPATVRETAKIAERLVAAGARRRVWAALVAYSGRPDFADQALALARYNRAVRLSALVRGLAASKERFQRRILRDRRIEIYPLGRVDITQGRIDVRVLVLMLYLRRAYGEVTVSSLLSGHRLFARPNVVSAHVYGQAVDISALGDLPIAGNQRPGGLTEHAVRDILLLPAEVQPRQVISLLGLGGVSFPLSDHADHIHVGF
jgi:hypothetical protein